jgi:hypothetical protein
MPRASRRGTESVVEERRALRQAAMDCPPCRLGRRKQKLARILPAWRCASASEEAKHQDRRAQTQILAGKIAWWP